MQPVVQPEVAEEVRMAGRRSAVKGCFPGLVLVLFHETKQQMGKGMNLSLE
mgnify:CR=1 FL=1